MQEPKFNGFEKDLGLDLLMNPRKKQGSDAISVSSRSSLNDDKMSVRSGGSIKSVSIQPAVIDVGNHMNMMNDDGDDDDYETETDVSYESEVSAAPQQNFQRQRRTVEEQSEDGSAIESLGIGSIMQDNQQRRLSEEDIIIMKKELLYQFERLEKKGLKMPKKFTLASNLDEMKMEYERLKRDKEIDSSVKLQRRMMMAAVSGVEWLNGKFDPLGAKLDGWSDSIYENIDDYDDIFEELHEKYKGKAKMAPELKLMMMLGGSAFMHHMTHSMFKSQLPGLDEILKQNPELAKNLAAATSQHMAHQQQSAGNLFGSIGNMFSGFFGGGGGGGGGRMPPMAAPQQPIYAQQMPPSQPKVSMKGPSNVDDLLKEFESSANIDNDRIEMMSAVTESELADLADDTSSINGILMGATKKKNKRGNKITLDI